MKKKIRQIIGVVLASTCVASALSACSKSSDKNTLIIDVADLGYGTDWLYALGEKFEELNEGVTVEIYPTTDESILTTQLMSGSSQADLMFETWSHWYRLNTTTVIGKDSYNPILEDLTDIFKTNIPGENVTIEDKYEDYVTDYLLNKDGKYYHFSWITQHGGIIYNDKVWKDDWALPRTTGELITLCNQIKENTSGVNVPFSYSLKNSYWGMCLSAWATQYEGIEAIKNYNNGYAPNGERYVPEMVLYDGFLKALEVLEELLKPSNGYMHPSSKEDNFTDSQVRFLEGGSVMQVNGDWLQSEMSANFSPDEVDIRMMKMPIVSSIVEKCSVVKDEAALCQVIDFIDGVEGASLPTGLTEEHEDVKKIKEARNAMSADLRQTAVIPAYSTKKDLAKKFLQFMASDTGIETFAVASGGYHPMFKFDYDIDSIKNIRSSFLNSVQELANKALENNTFFAASVEKDPIFFNGLSPYATDLSGGVETYLSATNSADYMTAQELILRNYDCVKDKWDEYMKNIK